MNLICIIVVGATGFNKHRLWSVTGSIKIKQTANDVVVYIFHWSCDFLTGIDCTLRARVRMWINSPSVIHSIFQAHDGCNVTSSEFGTAGICECRLYKVTGPI